MKGVLNDHFGIKRVFILGAGFSVAAGLPLTNKLLPLIHQQASKMQYGDEKWGQAERLLNKLRYYYPNIQITHEKIQSGYYNDYIDIEEFLSLASAHSSFLHPSDKLTQHGSYFISFCKKWLGEIILREQNDLLSRIPNFYHEFIKGLNSSLILTFNWDTIVETLLEQNLIKYRYQLNTEDYDNRKKSIPLIKMHGSVDWFSNRKISKKDHELKTQKLGNEYKEIAKAIGNPKEFYNNMNYPWIVLPNYDKITQLKNYGTIWEQPGRYLNDNLEVIIIGYSLRPDDFHSRSFIYPMLVRGSKDKSIKLKVIDFATTYKEQKEIKERYDGVINCKFWFNGFNKESVKFIHEQ